MADQEVKFLDAFGGWLRSLGVDAQRLADALANPDVPASARQAAASGLNYLFKKLDLIPDGIDDIGYLDDAFVLRVAAELALQEDVGDLEPDGVRVLNRLANDVDTVRDFLDKDFTRLLEYVKGLRK